MIGYLLIVIFSIAIVWSIVIVVAFLNGLITGIKKKGRMNGFVRSLEENEPWRKN